MTLENFTTDQLKNELIRRGFAPFIWGESDVDAALETFNDGEESPLILSSEQKIELICTVMNSGRISEEISDALVDELYESYSN